MDAAGKNEIIMCLLHRDKQSISHQENILVQCVQDYFQALIALTAPIFLFHLIERNIYPQIDGDKDSIVIVPHRDAEELLELACRNLARFIPISLLVF